MLVRDRQVIGILDFGDMVYSVVAADVAIAAAYALLDKPEPLAAIAAVVQRLPPGVPAGRRRGGGDL